MANHFNLRSATPTDVLVLFELIQSLAKYEQLDHTVSGNADALKEHLFGTKPYAEAIVVEYGEQVVGFALFFHNYSTFLTNPGIYVEDLFVLPEFRRKGIGKAMLTYIAQLAVSRGCGRLEWSVLDWNESEIAFYKSLGTSILPDWRICRVSANSLHKLAGQASVEFLKP